MISMFYKNHLKKPIAISLHINFALPIAMLLGQPAIK